MSKIDSNNYWQRKATYENISKIIPNFDELKPGGSQNFHDENNELHFEIIVYNTERNKNSFSDLIDYIQGEVTSKPSAQIIQQSSIQEIQAYLITGLIDAFARYTIGRGLNELFNSYDKVEMIDHKTGEVHEFLGSLENKQLAFQKSYKKGLGLDSFYKNSDLKAEDFPSRNFKDFLGKMDNLKTRFPRNTKNVGV